MYYQTAITIMLSELATYLCQNIQQPITCFVISHKFNQCTYTVYWLYMNQQIQPTHSVGISFSCQHYMEEILSNVTHNFCTRYTRFVYLPLYTWCTLGPAQPLPLTSSAPLQWGSALQLHFCTDSHNGSNTTPAWRRHTSSVEPLLGTCTYMYST